MMLMLKIQRQHMVLMLKNLAQAYDTGAQKSSIIQNGDTQKY
jgi:hypothetical protein